MTYREPARQRPRHVGSAVLAALAVVSGALLGIGSSSSSGPLAEAGQAPQLVRDHAPSLGGAGSVPDEGQPVLNAAGAAVTNLDPDLLEALRRAAADAARDGVELHVNSGWRSAQYQEQLLRDAIAEHGSEEEAARWVATPETSAHVSGDAVDVGPARAATWLSTHGAAFGLCQIYENEPWHYELRPDAVDDGCPAMYDNPTHDPRMQQ